jgi:tetratricopeptide (TPR) repeat protein
MLKVHDFASWVIGALANIDLSSAASLIERLVDAQLLEATGVDSTGELRYRFHDLLRDFARERLRAEERLSDQHEALARLLTSYLYLVERADVQLQHSGPPYGVEPEERRPQPEGKTPTTQFEPSDAIAWLNVERSNLVAMVEHAHADRWLEMTVQLATTLRRFFALRAYWTDWQRIQELALDAAKRLGDRISEANALRGLGDVHTEQGHYADAIACFKECLWIFRMLRDRRGEAHALRGLAIAYRDQGRPQQAVRRFEECREIYSELQDHRGNAYAEGSLGQLYRELGHLDEAINCLQRSLLVLADLEDERGKAYALVTLGEVFLDQGRPHMAIRSFELCLPGFRERDERRWQARTLKSLGSALAGTGELAAATAAWQEAFGIFKDLGLPESPEVAKLLDIARNGE